MTLAANLVSRWRTRADELDRDGFNGQPYRSCADDLEAWEDEMVDRGEAAKLAHRSPSYIKARERDGSLTNHGTSRKPLYRRGDLLDGKPKSNEGWARELLDVRE